MLDRTALYAAVDGNRCDAVISQLTAMKKEPLRHQDMAAANRLRIEGTANLLDIAKRVGAGRFVTQSMVFGYGYGDFGGRALTQADPFAPPGHGRFEEHLAAMRSGEQQVLDGPHVEGIALRYGLFYGPGPAGDALVDGLRGGAFRWSAAAGCSPGCISTTTTRRRSPRWNAAPPARPITSPMTSR